MSITFSIEGRPIQLKRHRFCRGRVYDPSAKDKQEWAAKIPLESIPDPPLTGPLRIELTFNFKRPKYHFRTGRYKNEIKEKYKNQKHVCTPDTDNLIKFALDAMNKMMYKDDSQVVSIVANKNYIDSNETEGITIVHIEEC